MKYSAAVLLALLAGCGLQEPTVIDGSSPEAFERSVEQARRDIPDADRIIFDRAIRTAGGRWHGARDSDSLARVSFDGMTAAEIVADEKRREAAEQR